MVFSSAIFLYLFLPLVLAGYFILPKKIGVRNTWLLLASYGFYAWGNVYYVPLLLGSTLIDFYCAKRIEASDRNHIRKRFLLLSVIVNVGTLVWFKYLGLFATTYQGIVGGIDASMLTWASSIALPVGISFYTFQSMSYTIDVYRREVTASSSFITFATYVSLFPQLVAGPIVRYSELCNQLKQRTQTMSKCAFGVGIFIIGLAKKVLIANPCGWIADQAFDAAQIDCVAAWTGLLAYGSQIYFDFSGYSEMAIGLGCLFGFTFPKNFNAPYKAHSLTDFWRRWHITLGAWLRDYIYVPLGGNRAGKLRMFASLMVVMLIAGIWHGALWGFVLWGGLHGLLLVVERVCGWDKASTNHTMMGVRVICTFVVVQLLWVLFRADSIELALSYYKALFSFSSEFGATSLLVQGHETYMMLLLAGVVVVFGKGAEEYLQCRTWKKLAVLVTLFVVSMFVLSEQSYNPFIYFRF